MPEIRIGPQTRIAVNLVEESGEGKLHARGSDQPGLEHQIRPQLPLDVQGVLNRIGSLQVSINHLEDIQGGRIVLDFGLGNRGQIIIELGKLEIISRDVLLREEVPKRKVLFGGSCDPEPSLREIAEEHT